MPPIEVRVLFVSTGSNLTIVGSGLTGNIPSSWTSLNDMQYFDLHSNRLSGQQASIDLNWNVLQYVLSVTSQVPVRLDSGERLA